MSPEELRQKIRAAAISFTEEVSAIFGEAFASVAAEFQPGAVAPKPAAAAPKKAAPKKVAPKKAAPKKVAPKKAAAPAKVAKPARAVKPAKAVKPATAAEKRNRRSANELDSVGDDVVKLLGTAKRGMRVEEINKALGTNTRQLMRPIQKLLNNGKIKKSGERRATAYFV